MLRVYRGWLFADESTEDNAEASKNGQVLRGTYREIITGVDKIEYERLREDD